MNTVLRCTASAALALLASSPAVAQPVSTEEDSTPKTLLMHYMPWYQTPDVQGYWGGHWTGWRKQHDPTKTDERGLPDLWSEFRPLIGPYDSADPDVVECHLLQMKIAGVDGVIVDWYGIGETADYPANQRGSVALFDACGEVGMTFAACYEDRTIEHMQSTGHLGPGETTAHLTETVAWLDEHWFHDDRYVRVDGRPLLLNFGPIHVKDATVWDEALGSVSPRPAYFALHHLWKGVGADGGFTWVHADAWETPDPEAIRDRLRSTYSRVSDEPSRTIVSALPGFDDVYDTSYSYVPHLGGATMEASLDVCMEGPWPIVQLVTWNDYGEGTVIEPTYEFGYRFLEIIQRARRDEVGSSFVYTPDDLRLPARLLAARRAAASDERTLDGVAAMIAAGRCGDAEAALYRIEGDSP
jgi:hypothetical protein